MVGLLVMCERPPVLGLALGFFLLDEKQRVEHDCLSERNCQD